MKPVIVAINTNEMVDNIFVLESQFTSEFLGKDVIIHHSPEMSVEGDRVSKNFDLMIDFTHKEGEPLFSKLLGKQYVAVPRHPTNTQSIMLMNLNLKGLRVPKVFMNLGSGHKQRETFVVPTVPKVVVKELDGARGTNQVLIKSHLLNRFLKLKDEPAEKLKSAFPDAVFTETYDIEQKFFFKYPTFVQEFVPDIVSEYRLLVGGDKILIRKRSTETVENETGEKYKHANINYNTFNACEESVFYPFPKPELGITYRKLFCTEWGFTEEQIKLVCDAVTGLDITLGSIDLFMTESGELGIFEWCHQFAYNNVDSSVIRNLHKSFIEHVIKESGVLEDV
jgi:hypothetical protein